MNVTLYKTPSSQHTVSKDISNVIASDVEINLIHPCDILSPEFFISYTVDRFSANYLYWNGRYYYCRMVLDTAKRIHVICHVDALMSWAAGIRNSNATVIRNGVSTTDIPDNKLPIPQSEHLHSAYLSMTLPDNNYKYAVTVYGG